MAEELQGQAGAGAVANEEQVSGFRSLLDKSLGRVEKKKRQDVETAIDQLVSVALQNTNLIADDTQATIKLLIAEIDKKLTAQVNLILHNEEFQKLEGAWRGLHHLITNSETGTDLKIRVLNISKKDLGKTLKKFDGTAWDQSPFFKAIYEAEFGTLGGEPYGVLIGDYEFDHGGPDVKLLEQMSQIAAAAHAPFIASAGPRLFQMESFQELQKPRDLKKIFTMPEYASWNSLRKSEDARYLGLTMPRFLARTPYGKDNPVDEFDFVEDTAGGSHDRYSWANAAYAYAVNLNRAFKGDGWLARIRGITSGGIVEGLPVHTFPTDDGGQDMKCPTEIGITDRREKELSDLGFLALIHNKNTDWAAFIGGQSVQEPEKYMDANATANANLSARLPYLFACCRFAHYLKVLVRREIGTFKTAEAMRKFLDGWITNYVDGDPDNSTDETKARKPLAAASVEVVPDESNPGYYNATFLLKPHYQLEGLTASLRLVGKMPTK